MAILTISREFGGSGNEIGQSLTARLRYEYIGRSRILEEMKSFGSQWERFGREFDEHSPNIWEKYDWSFQGFVALSQSIILNYGLKDRIVLMGRGGSFLFKGIPYALRIRLSMPRELRIERMMRQEGLSQEVASHLIDKVDKEMARTVSLIYGKRWDEAAEYDRIFYLGSASRTEEEVMEMIMAALVETEKLNTEKARNVLRLRARAAKVKAGIATNPSFLIPTLHVETVGEEIILRGIIHNPKEHRKIEEEARKLAGDIPLKCELRYRGLLIND